MRQEYMACEDDTILNVFYLSELENPCLLHHPKGIFGCCPIGPKGEVGEKGIPESDDEISFSI